MRGFIERLPLYVGGFLGPFGTIVIIPMFPELRDEFSATNAQVNLGFSLYLIPFAALLLVSGTLGERWGRRRTIRATYLLFVISSIAVAFAPNLLVFVAARSLQGIANAFITPLLIAGLAELVPAEKLGREIGIYSSFQALGGGLGPIIGGIAADTDWRVAFFGTAVISAVLAMFPPDGEPRPETGGGPAIRTLFNRQLLGLGASFFLLAAGPIGLGVIVGIAARDVFDLSGSVAGIVLLGGSLTALALGPVWGSLLDRLGVRRVAMIAISLVTLSCVTLTLADGAVSLGLLWAMTSGLTGLTVVVYQAVGATIMPENRGGALSFLLSFRFLGHAIGPLALVPLVDWSLDATLLIGAAPGVVALGLVLRSLVQVDETEAVSIG
ncbi:MAG: MFS transporter [Actinomycetota bacterium]